MIKNRKILLTGAAGGIGSQIAKVLASRGANLILADIRQSLPDAMEKELASTGAEFCYLCANLSTKEGREIVKSFIEDKYGELDILINCAGVNVFSLFEEIEEEDVESMITVNITSPILLTRILLPLLKKAEHGHIINFGSIFGSIGYPGFSIYSATKFAIRGFTETLRRELARTNLKVSYIAPRATRTGFNSNRVNDMNEALGVKMDLPEVVASQLLSLIEKNMSTSQYLGWPEKLFVKINSLFPKLVDRSLTGQLDTISHYAHLKPAEISRKTI